MVDPNDPLSPYYPAETPDVPGDGRTWFAVLVVVTLLVGAVAGVLTLLV